MIFNAHHFFYAFLKSLIKMMIVSLLLVLYTLNVKARQHIFIRGLSLIADQFYGVQNKSKTDQLYTKS